MLHLRSQTSLFDPSNSKDREVVDYDHVIGYYIKAANDECNQKRSLIIDIFVLFSQFSQVRFTFNR